MIQGWIRKLISRRDECPVPARGAASLRLGHSDGQHSPRGCWSWNRDQDGRVKDVSVKVSTGSLGWPGRVLREQELLWECPEDRAAELSCFRAKNQQVWDDPSKIQALRRGMWSPGRM